MATSEGAELRIRDIMTAPAVACRGETFLEEVAEALAERDVSGMPVVDERGVLVGVISERDLVHALGGPLVRLALRRPNHAPFRGTIGDMPRNARRVKDLMTSPAISIGPDSRIAEAARLMKVHQVNRLPVVDEGSLVGIVSRGDVLGAIAHLDHPANDTERTIILVGNESGAFPSED